MIPHETIPEERFQILKSLNAQYKDKTSISTSLAFPTEDKATMHLQFWPWQKPGLKDKSMEKTSTYMNNAIRNLENFRPIPWIITSQIANSNYLPPSFPFHELVAQSVPKLHHSRISLYKFTDKSQSSSKSKISKGWGLYWKRTLPVEGRILFISRCHSISREWITTLTETTKLTWIIFKKFKTFLFHTFFVINDHLWYIISVFYPRFHNLSVSPENRWRIIVTFSLLQFLRSICCYHLPSPKMISCLLFVHSNLIFSFLSSLPFCPSIHWVSRTFWSNAKHSSIISHSKQTSFL